MGSDAQGLSTMMPWLLFFLASTCSQTLSYLVKVAQTFYRVDYGGQDREADGGIL